MGKYRRAVLGAVIAGICVITIPPIRAEERVSQEQVVAFVDKMLDHIETMGEEQAFADFSDIKGPWIQGELYPFCHSLAGINVAHGGNPNMVGKGGVLDIRDPDGRYVNRLIFDKVLRDGKG